MYRHTFIGLDVHAVSVVGCALNPDTDELVRMAVVSDPAVALDWVQRFEPPVKAVYESGPTGYVLARPSPKPSAKFRSKLQTQSNA